MGGVPPVVWPAQGALKIGLDFWWPGGWILDGFWVIFWIFRGLGGNVKIVLPLQQEFDFRGLRCSKNDVF